MAIWLAAFAVAARITRYAGLVAYTAEPVLIPTEDGTPFRGAGVAVPVKPLADLETAWFGAGLVVRRERGELVITMARKGVAIVPLPASESFGAEPFEVRAKDRVVALAVLEAVSPLLGELRVHTEGEEFRVLRKPTPLG